MCPPIDYDRYPPNWKTEIVPAVLKRANNHCEHEGCTFKNGQLVFQGKKNNRSNWYATYEQAVEDCGQYLAFDKPVKVVLTVAHLDHDEENWNVALDRLKAMCQLHHLRYDAKEKYRRSLENWKK
jgi:hypothetical protein